MLTVSEHVYDEATGIDHYVFEPGAMKAQVKVTETNGEPQVLLLSLIHISEPTRP